MSARRFRHALRQLLARPSGSGHPSPAACPEVSATTAILYRIISGDPLAGDPMPALAAILAHEPEHPQLKKRWLLNRIADSDQRCSIIDLLKQHQQIWQELPFEASEYAQCWTDIGTLPAALHPWSEGLEVLPADQQAGILDYVGRAKSLYLYNRNAARNHAIQLGLRDAPWVLVWDADCFLPAESWAILNPLLARCQLKYCAVPVAEVDLSNLSPLQFHQPLAPDGSYPQFGIALGVDPPFNVSLRLGADGELDLARRLHLPGPWIHQLPQSGSWELQDDTPLPDRGQILQAGWAYRLCKPSTTDPVQLRQSIRLAARRIDMQLLGDALTRQPLRCWLRLAASSEPTPGLAAIAANARAVPPLSVNDKPAGIPGTPDLSYVNAVPHWQSLAGSESALDRTSLLAQPGPAGGDVAQHYDRARLQLMLDCVCVLALDGRINGNRESITHAHRLVRTWFLDPATAMIPDGAYARLSGVDPGRNVLDAATDFRDFYPLFDALTLLAAEGAFSLAEQQQLGEWFDAFLGWLAADSTVFLRQHSASSACTWYHLLMLALAAYRGRRNVAAQVFDNLPGLLARQFRPDGSPRSAASDSPLQHEHLFNLQAWANLVLLCSALGRDLFAFRDSNGHCLQAAFAHAQHHPPDDSGSAAWLAAMQAISQQQSAASLSTPARIPVLPDASSGLPPFWTLCQPLAAG